MIEHLIWRIRLAGAMEVLRRHFPGDGVLRDALELLRVRWLHDESTGRAALQYLSREFMAISRLRLTGEVAEANEWKRQVRGALIELTSAPPDD